MNYIFFGTPEFSTIILGKLIEAGYIPSGVVCNPDRPVGRKKIITPPPIKQMIGNQELNIKNKIKILQPQKLDDTFINELKELEPDLFIVASYAKIISRKVLDVPRIGTIGTHPSILPKYRGTSPIQNQILGGDKIGGTTLYLMDEGMDSGKIITQGEIQISNRETYLSLHDKLAKLSADLLIETLPKFLAGEIKPQEQNHKQATFTKKFITQDGFIEYKELEKAQNDGGLTAIEIDRKIRALNPEPGVWTLRQVQGKPQRMKILDGELTPENKLRLKVIQYEGKNPVKI